MSKTLVVVYQSFTIGTRGTRDFAHLAASANERNRVRRGLYGAPLRIDDNPFSMVEDDFKKPDNSDAYDKLVAKAEDSYI